METSVGKRIIQLRKSLSISQSELAIQLGISTMGVSRWERNLGTPSGIHLIKLGNLAHKDAKSCWSFWRLAGLTMSDVVRVLPIAEDRLRQRIPILRIVTEADSVPSELIKNTLMAIAFFDVVAAAGKGEPSADSDFAKAPARYIIAAPRLWCPNPLHTVSMRVKGSSMEPTLFDGYIIVVDQAQTDKTKLKSKMILARHDKFGLVVSRFVQIGRTEALISDNRNYHPVAWSSEWRMVGKILWYIGECWEE